MPVELPVSGVWDVLVAVDGADVSDRLTGRLRIEAEEGAARIAQFTLLPVGGVLAITDWVGQPVSIDIVQDGTAHRRFTGVVDHPRYDPSPRQVTLYCTDARQEKLDALDAAAVAALIPGSRWTPDIFDEDAEGVRHAEDRLSTIPASLDLALDGETWQLTPWAAKSEPAHSFGAVLDESLNIEVAERRNLLNRVEVDLDYRVTRLHHREVHFSWSWSWGGATEFCGWFADTTELPDKPMIRQAAEGGGWHPYPGSWSWVEQPPGQPPPVCGQFDRGWINPPWFEHVMGAAWRAAKRFSQAVTEQYRLAVRAPQSITRHGEVTGRERGVAYTEHDASEWEQAPALSRPDTDVRDAIGDWLIDRVDRAQSEAAIETLLHVARTRILAAHRRNYVSWQWPGVVPGLDRTDTVRVEAGGVLAQGKVAQLIEEADIDSGALATTIRIAVSRAGSDEPVEETPLLAPGAPPTYEPPASLQAADLAMIPQLNPVALSEASGEGVWISVVAVEHWDEAASPNWTWDSENGEWVSNTSADQQLVPDRDGSSLWEQYANWEFLGIRITASWPQVGGTIWLDMNKLPSGWESFPDSPLSGPFESQVFTLDLSSKNPPMTLAEFGWLWPWYDSGSVPWTIHDIEILVVPPYVPGELEAASVEMVPQVNSVGINAEWIDVMDLANFYDGVSDNLDGTWSTVGNGTARNITRSLLEGSWFAENERNARIYAIRMVLSYGGTTLNYVRFRRWQATTEFDAAESPSPSNSPYTEKPFNWVMGNYALPQNNVSPGDLYRLNFQPGSGAPNATIHAIKVLAVVDPLPDPGPAPDKVWVDITGLEHWTHSSAIDNGDGTWQTSTSSVRTISAKHAVAGSWWYENPDKKIHRVRAVVSYSSTSNTTARTRIGPMGTTDQHTVDGTFNGPFTERTFIFEMDQLATLPRLAREFTSIAFWTTLSQPRMTIHSIEVEVDNEA